MYVRLMLVQVQCVSKALVVSVSTGRCVRDAVRMPLPISDETIRRAQHELATLRAHGDRLAQQLAVGGRTSAAWAEPSEGAVVSPKRATRRSVERLDGFSVGATRDPEFKRAIAAEDERIAADLQRMRDEAEAAVARQQEEAAEEARRQAELNKTRQDLHEAARLRDELRAQHAVAPRRVPRVNRPIPGIVYADDIEWDDGDVMMAEDDELPLTALAEQARAQLRQAREHLDAQRQSSTQLATRGKAGAQARSRARQEAAIAQDGGWLGWQLGVGSLRAEARAVPWTDCAQDGDDSCDGGDSQVDYQPAEECSRAGGVHRATRKRNASPSQNPNHAPGVARATTERGGGDHRTRAVERPATAAAGSSRAGPGARPQRARSWGLVGGRENTGTSGPPLSTEGPVASSTRPASKLGHLQLEDAKQMAYARERRQRLRDRQDMAPAAPGPVAAAPSHSAAVRSAAQRGGRVSTANAPVSTTTVATRDASANESRRHMAHPSDEASGSRTTSADPFPNPDPNPTLQRISEAPRSAELLAAEISAARRASRPDTAPAPSQPIERCSTCAESADTDELVACGLGIHCARAPSMSAAPDNCVSTGGDGDAAGSRGSCDAFRDEATEFASDPAPDHLLLVTDSKGECAAAPTQQAYHRSATTEDGPTHARASPTAKASGLPAPRIPEAGRNGTRMPTSARRWGEAPVTLAYDPSAGTHAEAADLGDVRTLGDERRVGCATSSPIRRQSITSSNYLGRKDGRYLSSHREASARAGELPTAWQASDLQVDTDGVRGSSATSEPAATVLVNHHPAPTTTSTVVSEGGGHRASAGGSRAHGADTPAAADVSCGHMAATSRLPTVASEGSCAGVVDACREARSDAVDARW